MFLIRANLLLIKKNNKLNNVLNLYLAKHTSLNFNFDNNNKNRLKKVKHDNKILLAGRKFHLDHGNTSDFILNEKFSNFQIMKRMMNYVWPKNNSEIKKRVVCSLGLLVMAKFVNVSVPFILKHLIDLLNEFMSINVVGSNEALVAATSIYCLVIGYGAARVGSSLFNELRNAIFAKVSHDSIRRVAKKVFVHLLNLDLNFHLSRQTGALAKAVDRGTRGINFILSALVFNIVPTAFEVGIVCGILWYKCGGEFAAICFGCVSSYALFTFLTTQWRTKFRVEMNKFENEASTKAVDSLINYESVKYFNNEEFEGEKYEKVLEKFEKASLKTTTSLAILNFGQNFIFSLSLSAIMYLTVMKIITREMSIGDLVMVNGLLFQLSFPLNFLGSVYREVRQSLLDMQTMFVLLNQKSKIQNDPSLEKDFKFVKLDNADIEFKNVSFSYSKDNSILDRLTFNIKSGQKIGIVGYSGSGKSTILKLLYRLYDLRDDNGAIFINGKNIKKMHLEQLRRNICVVPQDVVLFNESILFNINYGNLQKGKQQVFEASKLCEMHDVIMKWPLGYDTIVGERGLKLSGGEKQRIGIARAMLKDSPILIFDEATSSLDYITEQKILRALKNASKGKTSIYVAHRLSSVVDADRILVLDKGSIIEEGSHNYLLNKQNSFYNELWRRQQQQNYLD